MVVVPVEREEAVLVLADGPTDGDVAGARGDRNEPAERYQPAHQVVEARAGERGDQPGLDVERGDPRDAGDIEDVAAGVLRGVAVAATEPSGDDPSRSGLVERLEQCFDRVGVMDFGARTRGAAPAGDQLVGHV